MECEAEYQFKIYKFVPEMLEIFTCTYVLIMCLRSVYYMYKITYMYQVPGEEIKLVVKIN